jgi:hypothetical protein
VECLGWGAEEVLSVGERVEVWSVCTSASIHMTHTHTYTHTHTIYIYIYEIHTQQTKYRSISHRTKECANLFFYFLRAFCRLFYFLRALCTEPKKKKKGMCVRARIFEHVRVYQHVQGQGHFVEYQWIRVKRNAQIYFYFLRAFCRVSVDSCENECANAFAKSFTGNGQILYNSFLVKEFSHSYSHVSTAFVFSIQELSTVTISYCAFYTRGRVINYSNKNVCIHARTRSLSLSLSLPPPCSPNKGAVGSGDERGGNFFWSPVLGSSACGSIM